MILRELSREHWREWLDPANFKDMKSYGAYMVWREYRVGPCPVSDMWREHFERMASDPAYTAWIEGGMKGFRP